MSSRDIPKGTMKDDCMQSAQNLTPAHFVCLTSNARLATGASVSHKSHKHVQIIDAGVLASQNPAGVRSVNAPKIASTVSWQMHTAFQPASFQVTILERNLDIKNHSVSFCSEKQVTFISSVFKSSCTAGHAGSRVSKYIFRVVSHPKLKDPLSGCPAGYPAGLYE